MQSVKEGVPMIKNRETRDVISETGSNLPDYNMYVMSVRERIMYILLAAVVIYIVSFIFYQNLFISLAASFLALLYPKVRTKEIIEKRKNELNLQFKDMLYSLSSSLSAGKSVESSFKEVLKDLSIIYPDSNAFIIKEVEYIVRKIEMNETIEAALEDFANRSHLEDIENFVDVFKTSKRAGGNIVEIIKNTSNIITDKIEVKEEIDTLLSARKFEQKVLTLMPVFLILFLSTSSKDYMYPIFNTLAGRFVMTVALILILAAYFISKKIMNIKI
ncbi:type II secretion system F family protein [Acetivibrio clariflavus]|uniref:Flp pilus assembly protein TadB n=2 Tax=Acetivibrio clariflavus TaxID=288965 RepID=G8LSP9_ACECE|nr:type II secretion system F family protein [Acetivibrio clariflavus]AEV69401.1 Flp pilus assembly protein TadB [Acetivibrio clariflavus DSM 19732]